MKTRKQICNAFALSAVLCLASCSPEQTDDTSLAEGKYPMTFTTPIEGLTITRGQSSEGMWWKSENIAVKIDGTIKKYTSSNSGKSAVFTSTEPFYWQQKNETKEVCAWYYGTGYNAELQSTWAVKSDQSMTATDKFGTGYNKSDFLYAPPQSISFNGSKNLSFYHQTAHVIIHILYTEAGESIGPTSIAIGSENNIALSGKYTPPVALSTVGTWDVNNATMGTINPYGFYDPSGNYFCSYHALVIPQDMSNKKFISVTMADGYTYYYIPKENEVKLESGKEYIFKVTVKEGGLMEVETTTTDAWNAKSAPINVASKATAPGFSATDLKIGDYYYSDGSTSDGGYRKYADDGTTTILDIYPELTNPTTGEERSVIGIVYWVDSNITKDNYGLLDSEYNHGLVAALWNIPTSTWTCGESESIDDWLKNATWPEGNSKPTGFTSIKPMDKIQGYANTIALREYNKAIEGNSGKSQNLRIKIIDGLDDFIGTHVAPTNSSGWFCPSVYELKYISLGQDNEKGSIGREMLNTQFSKVGGKYDKFGNIDYWSSTEHSAQLAKKVYFGINSADISWNNKVSQPHVVRPILAF